jgi:hypothetical protein
MPPESSCSGSRVSTSSPPNCGIVRTSVAMKMPIDVVVNRCSAVPATNWGTEPPICTCSASRRLRAGNPASYRPSYPIERRNLASRQAILQRITAEYDDMSGLRLTAAQAQRLFWFREDICERVLGTLVDAGVLRRDEDGALLRHDVQP